MAGDMLLTLIVLLAALLAGFLGYVATREGKFRYERSGLIAAPPERVFPFASEFKKGGLWSPYEQKDPAMKKRFAGPEGAAGSIMEFEGNREVGSGKLELLEVVPNERVRIRLTMIKPFKAENLVEYRLVPEAAGTRFFWIMSGDGGFMGKLMTTLIDCEKMIGDQFSTGIENLKKVVENELERKA